MSDGSGGGFSGSFEFIGEQAKNAAQGAGSAVKSVANTVGGQLTGQGGVGASNLSGSFDLKGGQMPQGGDLFAPDKKTATPQNPAQQMFGNTKPLTQAGQQAISGERVYTPEELQKIQSIEAEFRQMSKQNNNIDEDMEKARREREETYQKRLQEAEEKKEEKKMEAIQSQQQNQNIAVFQAARGTEIKGNQG